MTNFILKEGEEFFVKHRFSVSSNEVVESILKSSLIALKPCCKPLSRVMWPLIALFIPTGWQKGIMVLWIWAIKSIIVSTTGRINLFIAKSHINGIKFFWAFVKRRLAKFHGITDSTFYLHLKECEFRFNCRHQYVYKLSLGMFRDHLLF